MEDAHGEGGGEGHAGGGGGPVDGAGLSRAVAGEKRAMLGESRTATAARLGTGGAKQAVGATARLLGPHLPIRRESCAEKRDRDIILYMHIISQLNGLVENLDKVGIAVAITFYGIGERGYIHLARRSSRWRWPELEGLLSYLRGCI